MKFKDKYIEFYTFDHEYYADFDNGYLTDGFTKYYKGYLLHREDGPALINGDLKQWYYMGERHREYGPAIEWPNGEKSYFIKGIRYTKKEFYNIMNLKTKNKVLNEI
jgi:hypothetical protein